MFLTNLDTVAITFFLGSGIILVVLFGLMITIRLRYRETKFLLPMFLRLIGISLILLSAYCFILFFRWPGVVDFLIFAFINVIVIFGYIRLFSVFRQFIRFYRILISMFLIAVGFGIFTINFFGESNLIFLEAGFISLLTVINLHFLAISTLIKLRQEPKYEG